MLWLLASSVDTLYKPVVDCLLRLQGIMNHDLSLEADDIAEAALLPLRTTALCVPKEVTLDTTQLPG